MQDQSHLDTKYFLDGYKYNCPFCKRRSVAYEVVSHADFDRSSKRKVHIYIVRCGSCGKESLHLSDFDFSQSYGVGFNRVPQDQHGKEVVGFEQEALDKYFFYHQPTSFFSVNDLIPAVIRDLVTEADGCRTMNFLVGGSGALRKAIYEFLEEQKVEGVDYKIRIKSLKQKYPSVPPEYFDALAGIQDMTSSHLHEREGSWEAWDGQTLEYLIQVVREVLEEIYVKPVQRTQALKKVSELRVRAGQASGEVGLESTPPSS